MPKTEALSLKNQVSQERLRKIAESIWTSKMRYGLQLYGEVRQTDEAKRLCNQNH